MIPVLCPVICARFALLHCHVSIYLIVVRSNQALVLSHNTCVALFPGCVVRFCCSLSPSSARMSIVCLTGLLCPLISVPSFLSLCLARLSTHCRHVWLLTSVFFVRFVIALSAVENQTAGRARGQRRNGHAGAAEAERGDTRTNTCTCTRARREENRHRDRDRRKEREQRQRRERQREGLRRSCAVCWSAACVFTYTTR